VGVRFVVNVKDENEKDVIMALSELVTKGKLNLTDVDIKHF
jgi:chromatin segregation and condensation protein Rec8/ScpA/Scc1 (kleisin family)